MLAVAEGVGDHVGAELDGAGHVHQGVDLGGAGEQGPVVGDGRPVVRDRVLEVAFVLRHHRLDPGVPVGLDRLLEMAVVDGHHAFAGDGVDDLVQQAAAHEAGADHADPDGVAGGLTGLQGVVDDDHGLTSRPRR